MTKEGIGGGRLGLAVGVEGVGTMSRSAAMQMYVLPSTISPMPDSGFLR